MFIDYLIYRHGGINFRIDREVMIEWIWNLTRVLDEAENHWRFSDCDDIIYTYNGNQKNRPKESPSLSPVLTEQLLHFIEYHPVKRFDKISVNCF